MLEDYFYCIPIKVNKFTYLLLIILMEIIMTLALMYGKNIFVLTIFFGVPLLVSVILKNEIIIIIPKCKLFIELLGLLFIIMLFCIPLAMLGYSVYGMKVTGEEEKIRDNLAIYTCQYDGIYYHQEGKRALGYGTFKLTSILDEIDYLHFGRNKYLGHNKTKEELFSKYNSDKINLEKNFITKFKGIFTEVEFLDCLFDPEMEYFFIRHKGNSKSLFPDLSRSDPLDMFTAINNIFKINFGLTVFLFIFGFIILFCCVILSIDYNKSQR